MRVSKQILSPAPLCLLVLNGIDEHQRNQIMYLTQVA